MSLRTRGWLALALAAGAGACQKIPDHRLTGPIRRDPVPDSTAIPAAWGKLVSVTVNPAFTDVFQLWLQDSTGRIHIVVYQAEAHRLSPMSPVITRN